MKTVDPEKVSLEDMMEQAVEFHGHLGPYLVLGIRMGLLALRELSSSGYEGIEAIVKTGDVPSLSCLLDGIQVSTGCTMGKGNIRSVPPGRAEADFSTSERRVTIRVKDEIVDEIKSWRERYATLEEIAQSISKRPDEELFRAMDERGKEGKGGEGPPNLREMPQVKNELSALPDSSSPSGPKAS